MDGTPANTVQLSAVTATPIPEQHVTLNWKIDNIKRHLYFAERTTDDVFTVATLPFEIGGPSLFENADKVFFSWKIVDECIPCQYKPPRDPNDPRPPIPIPRVGQEQWLRKSVVSVQLLAHGDRGLLKGLKRRQLCPDLYIDYSIGVKSRDQEKRGHFKQSQLGLRLREREDPEKLKLWKCELFSSKEDLFGYYLNDEDGSLTIELKISAYLHVIPETVLLHGGEGDDMAAVMEFGGERRLLKKVALLMGDIETSDVVISLVCGIDDEIKRFYVHSAILSAQSSVFRAMLRDKDFVIENELKVIEIKTLTSGWTFHQKRTLSDAFEQFLTFLYTGQFKDERTKTFDYPDWVILLPELSDFAVTYDVKDLLEFCDTNFHRAARRYAPSLLLSIAKLRGLNQAEAKLLEMFKDLLRD